MPRKTQTEQRFEDARLGASIRRQHEVMFARAKLKGLYELRDQIIARMQVLQIELATGIPSTGPDDPLQGLDVYAHRL